MSMKSAFDAIARKVGRFSGSAPAFVGALLIVLVWAASGPFFKFGETWQLVINTGTTIVTFLMVFLIQRTQNTDTTAMQIKLDELIRAIGTANNKMLALEELDEDTLERLRTQFEAIAKTARVSEGHHENDPGPCEANAECDETKDQDRSNISTPASTNSASSP